MLCTVINGPTLEEANKQIAEANSKSDFLEFRIDLFDFKSLDHLQALMKAASQPVIFTLRSKDFEGGYSGSESERLQELDHLTSLKPAMVDLEMQVPRAFCTAFRKKHPYSQLILSYHNFNETPLDLDSVFYKLASLTADFYKIALMANSSLDALRLLNFLKEKKLSNVIGISMGSSGELSRVVNPKFNSLWTYTFPDISVASAPGQLSLSTLTQQFGYREIDRETSFFALLGNPIDKSRSHITHNAVFQTLDLKARYLKVELLEEELTQFFALALPLGFQGFSVTMPLKEKVQPFLDDIDEFAKAAGSVNTIQCINGKLKGFNTDGPGACNAIKEHLQLNGKKIAIIGAGGSAKAIALALKQEGCEVSFFCRRESQATEVASFLGCQGFDLSALNSYPYDLLINCTPASNPIDPSCIRAGATIMDINAVPQFSDLLKEAEKKGCKLILGHEMFVHQAALQFKIWFQTDPSQTLPLLKSYWL